MILTSIPTLPPPIHRRISSRQTDSSLSVFTETPTRFLLMGLLGLAPLVFLTRTTTNPYAIQIALIQMGVGLLWIMSGWRLFRRGEGAWRPHPLMGVMGIFALLALLSWGISLLKGPYASAVWVMGGSGLVFLFFNGFSPWFFSLQTADPAWTNRMDRWVLGVGIIVSAYGLLQYLGADPFWAGGVNTFGRRPVSTLGNPNFLASYLVLLLPLSVFKWGEMKTPLSQLFALGVSGLMTSALVVTMTRTAWLGALVGLAVTFTLGRETWRKKTPLYFGGLLLLASLTAYWFFSQPHTGPSPYQRWVELWGALFGHKTQGSLTQRLLIFHCAIDLFRQRPWLGWGWGTFELFAPFIQGRLLLEPVYASFRTHPNNVHMVLLEWLVHGGLLGLGVTMGGIILWVQKERTAWAHYPALDRTRRTALWGGLVGFLVDNLSGNVTLFFPTPAFLFFWMAGQLSGGEGIPRENHRVFWVRGLGLSLLLSGGAVAVFSARSFVGQALSFRADALLHQQKWAEGVKVLENSRRWNPADVHSAFNLGNAYVAMARLAGVEGGATLKKKALVAFDAALGVNPGYEEIHHNRAALLMEENRWEESAESLQQALNLNPLRPDTYQELGWIYLNKLKDPAQAERIFSQAVRVFPQDQRFWEALGYSALQRGDPPAAQQAFAKARALKPSLDKN